MNIAIEQETALRVADEVWIALAALHRKFANRGSFSAQEILGQARAESAHPTQRPGLLPHIYLHNVATLPPNAAQYRMITKLDDGTYRLYRPGDPVHPARHGKTKPIRLELPEQYRPLLDWYELDYLKNAPEVAEPTDPVLELWGLGRDVWAGVDADEYVAGLRAGWSDDAPVGGPDRPVRPVASSRDVEVWNRVKAHQGETFRTKTNLPFQYELDGEGGIWFLRDGRRINKRLSRADLIKALQRCPLENVTDIRDCFDPSYLFGLLMDKRIRREDW